MTSETQPRRMDRLVKKALRPEATEPNGNGSVHDEPTDDIVNAGPADFHMPRPKRSEQRATKKLERKSAKTVEKEVVAPAPPTEASAEKPSRSEKRLAKKNERKKDDVVVEDLPVTAITEVPVTEVPTAEEVVADEEVAATEAITPNKGELRAAKKFDRKSARAASRAAPKAAKAARRFDDKKEPEVAHEAALVNDTPTESEPEIAVPVQAVAPQEVVSDLPQEEVSEAPEAMPIAVPEETVAEPEVAKQSRAQKRAAQKEDRKKDKVAPAQKVETYRGFPVEELIEDLRLSWTSRELDHRQLTLHKQGKSYFCISGSGHESLLTGVARSLRVGYDWFFPYYRDLTMALALGITPYDVLLHAVGSAEDLDSGGRQMPHHFSRKEMHIISQSSPTGSQCLVALGCAEASRYISGRELDGLSAANDEVTYVSIGDGATSEGEVWESFNTASRLKLPIVYLVEDNGYAISLPTHEQAAAPVSHLVRAYPNFFVAEFDGCDYFTTREASAAAIAHVRAGNGPALLHAHVTRPNSHSSSDDQTRYRLSDDLAREASRDPLFRLEAELIANGVVTEEFARSIQQLAHDEIAEDAIQALAAARPDPTTATDHLWKLPVIPDPVEGSELGGEIVHFKEAIRLSLFEAMEDDLTVRVFGEDVADGPVDVIETLDGLGGVFGTTAGLQRRFGADRCFNTPLAEANIVGRAVGQAVRGLHPSPEIQFFDYIWPAMHQIRAEAATTRWRSNGDFTVPMVLRCPIGGYVTGGAIWHSQSGESIFAHIPGLVVVFPSRARDAAGLMRAAFQCEDPVLFLEHKALLRQRFAMDPYPPRDYVIPLGKAATARTGSDLTIVTWGATVHRSMLAADQLAEEGLDIEIIDLRTIMPWDKEAVAESVARTGRLLVVHEDTLTGGFGGEIAAYVADECFDVLDAPVRRVGAKDAWVGYEPSLERAVLPQTDDIVDAARKLGLY